MLSNPSFPHSPFPQLPSPHGVFCSKSSTFKLFFIIPYCVNFLLVQDLIISCLHCWNISQNLLPLQGQTVIVASSLVSLSLVVPAIPLPPAPIHWAHTGRLMFLMPLPCSKKHAKAPNPLGLTGYATLCLTSTVGFPAPTLCPHYCFTWNVCLQAFFMYYVLCYIFKSSSKPCKSTLSSTLSHHSVMFMKHLSGCDYIQLWPHH